MKAIGCYLLFIISLAGMTLSDDDTFSEENKKKFLDHIFDLHNMFRTINRVKPLKRTDSMDYTAYWILQKKMFQNIDRVPEELGVNYYLEEYNNNTKLDEAQANFIFSGWYFAKFSNEPQINKADASKEILWEGTNYIGLAMERTNNYYAVVALYFPCYKTGKQEQFASNNSKP